jgi:hypothetical protein
MHLIGERGMKLRHMRPQTLLHAEIVAMRPLREFYGLRLALHRGGIVPRLWLRLEAGGYTPCLQLA